MKPLAFPALLFSFVLPIMAEPAANSADRRPNILLITADDLSADSLGVYGCKVKGITPNLDGLPAQGMRFEHAHVNIAVCQPSRQSIMTGMYPHRNGGEGFEPINDDVRSLTHRITEDEVEVPSFLPDLPAIRKEIAEYLTSVHRCDQVVGAVLRALRDTGQEENTLVMFLSDNGIAVPFAKSNCYLHSTKTPWIVRWPRKVKAGMVDGEYVISGIDYMPTVLDALGFGSQPEMDGASFLSVLKGGKQPGREYAFTEYHRTHGNQCYPMRAIQGKRFGYIVNFWAGRTTPMRMESLSGLTFRAMQEAAKNNPEIAARVELFEHRTLEEFYDFDNDPDAFIQEQKARGRR